MDPQAPSIAPAEMVANHLALMVDVDPDLFHPGGGKLLDVPLEHRLATHPQHRLGNPSGQRAQPAATSGGQQESFAEGSHQLNQSSVVSYQWPASDLRLLTTDN